MALTKLDKARLKRFRSKYEMGSLSDEEIFRVLLQMMDTITAIIEEKDECVLVDSRPRQRS